MDLRLPATEAPDLPPLTESERIGDTYAVIGLDARRQVTGLFRPVLDRMGAVTNAALTERRPGPVRIGGLVVTRQHPMTAKGTVFLAVEDETGMVNVTLWPDTWARLRSVVRRHALLLIDGDLQREGSVVNVVARDVRPLPELAAAAGGPDGPTASARPAMPGCAGSAERPARAASAGRRSASMRRRCACLPSLPVFLAAARRPRFGFESCRNRRYQAAAAANSAPMTGEQEHRRTIIASRAIAALRGRRARHTRSRPSSAIGGDDVPTIAPMQPARPRRQEARRGRRCRSRASGRSRRTRSG